MHITIKVVSPNPAHGRVYSIQLYVIKFVSDFWQVVGFPTSTLVSSTNKTDSNNIARILFKVVLSTIALTPNPIPSFNRSFAHFLFDYKIIGFYSVIFRSYFPYNRQNSTWTVLIRVVERTKNLSIIFFWFAENLENSHVVTTLNFSTNNGKIIYYFHRNLHERGLFFPH